MTHGQFITIEHCLRRAVNAISQFADVESRSHLRNAEYLLSEMRFCAEWMCDPKASDDEKAEAMRRLSCVFSTKLY